MATSVIIPTLNSVTLIVDRGLVWNLECRVRMKCAKNNKSSNMGVITRSHNLLFDGELEQNQFFISFAKSIIRCLKSKEVNVRQTLYISQPVLFSFALHQFCQFYFLLSFILEVNVSDVNLKIAMWSTLKRKRCNL